MSALGLNTADLAKLLKPQAISVNKFRRSEKLSNRSTMANAIQKKMNLEREQNNEHKKKRENKTGFKTIFERIITPKLKKVKEPPKKEQKAIVDFVAISENKVDSKLDKATTLNASSLKDLKTAGLALRFLQKPGSKKAPKAYISNQNTKPAIQTKRRRSI